MREFISGLQKKDENHEQIEPLDSKVFKEFNDLRTKLKKLEEDYANLTNAAKAKLERITNITRDLLGWEIKETEEFIELKNVLTSDKNNVVVFKRQENAYHIVDTKENQATFIKVAKEIIELFNNTYPVFFSVVNIEMKPEYKELVKKCIE